MRYPLTFVSLTSWLLLAITDRLAALQIKLRTHYTLTIINAYGPTKRLVNNNQDLQEDFCSQLAALTTRYSSNSLFIIAGDFNSKLGRKQADELSLGEHSCGTRNRNGTALADFLEVHRLFVCNTALQHAARYKTTWQWQYRDTATGDTLLPILWQGSFQLSSISSSVVKHTRAFSQIRGVMPAH